MIPVRVVLLSPPPPPSLPLAGRWEVVGLGWVGGGGWFAGASRDTCFLLSGPKWNPDKNTPLVAACRLWVAAFSGADRGARKYTCQPASPGAAEGYREGPVALLILTFSIVKPCERTRSDCFRTALTCRARKMK